MTEQYFKKGCDSMSDKKVIYSKGDVLFTVKTTEGKGSGVRRTPPLPKQRKFKVDVYLLDGRTFSFVSPAFLYHYDFNEILEEALHKIAIFLYAENPDRIVYPRVSYSVVSACHSDKNLKYDREKWECCYWSDGKSETLEIGSYITNLVASSVSRTEVNWDEIMRGAIL